MCSCSCLAACTQQISLTDLHAALDVVSKMKLNYSRMACLELLKIGFLMRIIENPIQTTGSFSIIRKSGGEKNRRLNWEPTAENPALQGLGHVFTTASEFSSDALAPPTSEIELGAENPVECNAQGLGHVFTTGSEFSSDALAPSTHAAARPSKK
jgi:hypothetical protein